MALMAAMRSTPSINLATSAPKSRSTFLQRQPAFPHRAVQNSGHQRLGIQAQIEQNLRHFQAHLHTVDGPVGAVNNGFVRQLFGQRQGHDPVFPGLLRHTPAGYLSSQLATSSEPSCNSG